MARKDGRVSAIAMVHSTLIIIWTIVSTIIYGLICLSVCLFSSDLTFKIGRFWSIHLLAIAGIKVKVRGAEKLDPNKRYVFFANHQSALDIPVMYAGMKNAISFIAKKELFFIPMFGWVMAAMGHIWIDRSNARKARDSILKAIKHLHKANVSLVLFPEGTRSVDGTIGEFKTGSFTLALQAGVQAVPVVLHDTRLCLPKNAMMMHPGIIHVDIGDTIDIDESTMSKNDLCIRIRNTICEIATAGPQN